MIRSLIAVNALLLAGCAGSSTSFPSLAPRPIEKLGFDEPVRAAVAVTADPALDARIVQLDARLGEIRTGFTTASRDAERKSGLARGRIAGSDPWLEAQTALAVLDDWRAQASALATDIEQLAIARAVDLAPDYPRLTALSQQAETEAQQQGETITRLQAMLAPA